MATSSVGQAITKTFLADVDLSSYQYYVMGAASTAGKITPIVAHAGSPMGVLQNDPTLGEEATLVVFGPTKVRATSEASASPLTFGGWVKSSSTGMATGFTNAAASAWGLGMAYEALASGSGVYLEIFVMPQRIV